MIRHIVMWNYKDGFTAADNKANARQIKQELEALTDCIEGIIELKVYIDVLPSSNKDIILDSLFTSEEALAAYQTHPGHQRVSAYVGSVLQDRVCIDHCC